MLTKCRHRVRRPAFSLLEVLAIVTILGILVGLIVPRFTGQAKSAQHNACAVNQGNIEIQCQLWYRNQGSWPAGNLANIGADRQYFPDGLPRCPVDGSSYTLDSNSGLVIGHNH